jgi:hypothetical protein
MRWDGTAEEDGEEVVFDGALREVGDVECCVKLVDFDLFKQYSSDGEKERGKKHRN